MSLAVSAADTPPLSPPDPDELRLVHHMARSGGTVISKCLGCMHGVALLSEIHPGGTRYFNPIAQARAWYGVPAPDDLARIAPDGRIDFAAAVALIRDALVAQGRHLVLRDWSHLDFTGVPFARPSYRLLLAEALRTRCRLRQVCTVRHPLDQWQSVSRLAVMQDRLRLAPFLLGYRRFAEAAVEIGFLRYEDFTRAPADLLRTLCARLGLPFDPGFADRWADYDRITGDVRGSRGGREIRPVARREVPPELLDACAANADYRRALDLLGYDHPG